MNTSILVIGESGSGKSTSIRNLDPKSTFIINITGKALPIKGANKLYKPFNRETNEGNLYSSSDPIKIINLLKYITKLENIKTIIIDDFQYLMGFEFIKRAKERGYDKFSEIGQNAFNVITQAQNLREDQISVILAHSEDIISDNIKKTKIKTIGRMLDEKITIEGLFSIVLLSQIEIIDNKINYYFVTNSDGSTTAKSPLGMFEYKIPNDLNYVINTVKHYLNNEGENNE